MIKKDLFLVIGYTSLTDLADIKERVFADSYLTAVEAADKMIGLDTAICRYTVHLDGATLEYATPPIMLNSLARPEPIREKPRAKVLDLERFRERKICNKQR